jgi:hypothetical protein
MIFYGLSIGGFVVALCFAAGFLFANRAGRTRLQVFLLGIFFGIAFLCALCGLAVAGCIAVFTAASATS